MNVSIDAGHDGSRSGSGSSEEDEEEDEGVKEEDDFRQDDAASVTDSVLYFPPVDVADHTAEPTCPSSIFHTLLTS